MFVWLRANHALGLKKRIKLGRSFDSKVVKEADGKGSTFGIIEMISSNWFFIKGLSNHINQIQDDSDLLLNSDILAKNLVSFKFHECIL